MFSCWIYLFKFGNIQVKVFVVKSNQNLLPDDITQLLHIKNISGIRIWFTYQLYNQLIVVAMPVWVVTLSKYTVVF